MATIRYAVLFGKDGVSEFRSKDRAEKFAQRKANQLNESVTIDRVKVFSMRRDGRTGSSQRFLKTVKPKRSSTRKRPTRNRRAVRRTRQTSRRTRNRLF